MTFTGIRHLAAVAAVLLLSGCTGSLVLAPQLHGGQGFSTATGETPAFTEKTFGHTIAAAAGSYAAQHPKPGHVNYLRHYRDADTTHADMLAAIDPAPRILAAMEKTVASKMNWHKQGKGAPFTVAVETFEWGIHYHPIKLARYEINYIAKMEIKESHAKNPQSARFWCFWSSADVYPYKDIFADNAKILKNELAIAARACVDELSTGLKDQVAKQSAAQ